MIECLQNVYVGNHGLVFDENGDTIGLNNADVSPYAMTVNDYGANTHMHSYMMMKDLKIDEDRKHVKEMIRNKKYIEVEDRPYIYAFHYFNIFVWGHLHDTLNKLEDFEGCDEDFKLAVPLITNHVKDLFLHFELIGYKKEDVFSFSTLNGEVYKFKKLYINKKILAAVMIGNKNWIEKKYIYENPYIKESIEGLKNKKYKLYLSRNNLLNGAAYPNGRKTINEPEVWDILKNKGYIMLNGDEGLIEHIKYFIGADKIIFVHGSMIRNIMFCLNKDVEVWEFYPLAKMFGRHKYMSEDVFQKMSRRMGMMHYYYLPIESEDDWSVRLDLELIKRIS